MSNHFRITSGDIRIAILEDGTYDVMCWSMPLQGNRRTVMFKQDIPQYIQDALEWCGIEPDYAPWKGGPNGPYRQSERDYSTHIQTLLDKGMAYYAFDTEEDMAKVRSENPHFAYDAKTRMSMKNSLSLSKEEVDALLDDKTPFVIRFKTPENRTITVTDVIRGEVSLNTNQTDDKVLVKSNGIPTYHMANVCDDHDMGTTHVIRGEEWLPSTPLHLMLYEAFGWQAPTFAHLPLILNPDGKGKLSKRKALSMGIPAFPMGGEGEDDKGNVVKVNFGDPNMEIKRDDPDRRKSYRARHHCSDPGPKWKANYWSCKFWGKTPVSKLD